VIGGERFNMPIIGTMANNDRVKDEHMHGWSTFTSSSFELHELDGSHNFIQGESGSGLQTKAKRQLHQIILQAADEHLAC
jgi:surfactin synthase thioesterase subunit